MQYINKKVTITCNWTICVIYWIKLEKKFLDRKDIKKVWSILTDNLSAYNLLDVCKNSERKNFKNNYYIQRYLYAVILWDAIYSVPRKSYSTQAYSKADKKRKEKKDNELIKKIKNSIHNLPFDYHYNELEELADYIYDEEKDTSVLDKKSKRIEEDVKFYLTMGEISNMNTLLSEERNEYIEKTGIANRIWTREEVLKYLDREVFEIYREVYAFMGKDIIRLQSPLLIDYICDNALTLQDAINIAFQLKENKDIIQFRYTMDSLDNAINSGNLLLLKEYQNTLSEIVEQFTRKEVKSKKIDFRLTFTPSLTKPSISAAFGIPMEYNEKRKINMNFLINLTQYGLSQNYRR